MERKQGKSPKSPLPKPPITHCHLQTQCIPCQQHNSHQQHNSPLKHPPPRPPHHCLCCKTLEDYWPLYIIFPLHQRHKQLLILHGTAVGSSAGSDLEHPNPASLNLCTHDIQQELSHIKEVVKGRAPDSMNTLVQQTESPFMAEVLHFPLLVKFRMPQIEAFDGAKDLVDHLNTYKNQMELHGYEDPVRCRAFAITLKGSSAQEPSSSV